MQLLWSDMSDYRDNIETKLSAGVRLFVQPAICLLQRAKNYFVQQNVGNCVNKRRETINRRNSQPRKKRQKNGDFLKSVGLEVPQPLDGFFVDSSQVSGKYSLVGIGAEWSTVEQVMIQHGVGGYHFPPHEWPRPHTLDIDKTKQRHKNGIHVATLEPNCPFDGDRIPSDAIVSLADRLSKTFLHGDEVFAICAYMHGHLKHYKNLLEDETKDEYQRKLEKYKDIQKMYCTECGLTVYIAAFVVWKLKSNNTNVANRKYNTTCRCLFCGPPVQSLPSSEESAEFCPTLPRDQLDLLIDLVEKVTTSEGSVFAADKFETYSNYLLNDRCGEGEWVNDFMTDHPKLSKDAIKKNIEDYYDPNYVRWQPFYKLQNLELANDKPAELTKKEFIGKTLGTLTEKYCPDCLLMPGQNVSNLCGVLIDHDKRDPPNRTRTEQASMKGCQTCAQLLGASQLHLDPAWAINILFLWTTETDHAATGPATWLIVAPRMFSEALNWWKAKLEDRKAAEGADCSKVMDLDIMTAMKEEIGKNGGVWVVEQNHGQVVQVPVGYAHAVTNRGRNMKIARDCVVPGQLHRCILSYIFLWRKMERLTDEYVQFVPISTNGLLPYLKKKKTANK